MKHSTELSGGLNYFWMKLYQRNWILNTQNDIGQVGLTRKNDSYGLVVYTVIGGSTRDEIYMLFVPELME